MMQESMAALQTPQNLRYNNTLILTDEPQRQRLSLVQGLEGAACLRQPAAEESKTPRLDLD